MLAILIVFFVFTGLFLHRSASILRNGRDTALLRLLTFPSPLRKKKKRKMTKTTKTTKRRRKKNRRGTETTLVSGAWCHFSPSAWPLVHGGGWICLVRSNSKFCMQLRKWGWILWCYVTGTAPWVFVSDSNFFFYISRMFMFCSW